MQHPHLRGVMTALVTPFHDDGSIDFPAHEALVKAQLDAGVHGLVPCGTTGEASTLSTDEHIDVVRACLATVKQHKPAVPVIAGAGSNDTHKAVAMHKRVGDLGVDAALHVTPWYNKPTQEGLYRHFRAIAEASALPVVLYNVPGRTGVDLLPETVVRLAKDQSNIIAIKEATGSIQRAQDLLCRLEHVRPNFSVLSGDDGFILGLLAIGGHGVISVTSHLCCAELVAMVAAFDRGEMRQAQALSRKVSPLGSTLFFRSNPIPVKTALADRGLMRPVFRAPLCPLTTEEHAQFDKLLSADGWK